MTMRFRVQYLDDGRWRYIRSGADSGGSSSATPRAASTTRAGRFEFRPPSRAARTSCAASSTSMEAQGRARSSATRARHRGRATRARPAPTRRTSPPRPARSPSAPNSRGSFVMTPRRRRAPRAARISRGVVDRPHVELAARVAHGAHEPRRDEPVVGHHRVAAARARRAPAASAGQPPAPCSSSAVARARIVSQRAACSRGARAAPTSRAAARGSSARSATRLRMYSVETSVRSTQAVLAQRLDHALLVAGQLEVDVELDAANASRGEVLEALLERRARPARRCS